MDKKWWTLLAVCAGMFMLLLDVTSVVVAQPAIQSGLHASLTDVQWVLDAYALTLASLLLTSGVLADRYGRKLLFKIGLVSLVYGLIRAGETTWSDAGVIACLALAAVALAGFIAAERRVAHPMFDLSLLRVPTFAGGSIAAFAMNGSLYAVL